LEAQDEGLALTGTLAELDHFDEPKSGEPDCPAITLKSLPTTASKSAAASDARSRASQHGPFPAVVVSAGPGRYVATFNN